MFLIFNLFKGALGALLNILIFLSQLEIKEEPTRR